MLEASVFALQEGDGLIASLQEALTSNLVVAASAPPFRLSLCRSVEIWILMLCFDEQNRVYFTRAPERQLASAPEVDFTRLIFPVKSHQIESIDLSIQFFLWRSVEIVELWMETIHTNRVAVTKQLHENRQSQLCYLESVIKEKHEQCLNQTPLNLGHSTRDVDEKVSSSHVFTISESTIFSH
jgi:hypothetical protein